MLRVLGDLARRRRRIRPTREGWVFLGSALAVALAALNTGNNLLYLVFATQLAMVALSGVLSELSVQQLRLGRRLAGPIFAGVPVRGEWLLHNPRRWLPNLALTVREGGRRGALLTRRGDAHAPVLSPGEHLALPATWAFEARGEHRLTGIRVATTWPFGIFEKYYELAAPLDVLVHPRPTPRGSGRERPVGRDPGAAAGRRRGDDDFLGLRDHQPGDDPRRVHWRTSARLGRLVSVERARRAGGALDVRVPPPAGPRRGEEFELSLGRATRAVLDATTAGRAVTLSLPGQPPIASGPGEAASLLEALARAEVPG